MSIKALARQQELDQRMRAAMTPPSPDGAYRLLRRRFGFDPATARRMAGLDPTSPAAPVLPAAPSSPPASPPAEFWAGLASEYVRGIQRPAPAVAAPAAPAPAPISAPPPSKPSAPREIAFHRDIDGNLIGQVGDQRIRFQRNRNGEIESAESTDGRVVIFRRDLNGTLIGARIEPKEPKP